jgi:hypothetical protein
MDLAQFFGTLVFDWLFKILRPVQEFCTSFGSYTLITFFLGFPTFWTKCHWRDFISRNAHMVLQNWYFISFTFVKYHSDSIHKYSEFEIKKMLEFLIDNICVGVGGQVFQQSVGNPMGTNCAPLLVDPFL